MRLQRNIHSCISAQFITDCFTTALNLFWLAQLILFFHTVKLVEQKYIKYHPSLNFFLSANKAIYQTKKRCVHNLCTLKSKNEVYQRRNITTFRQSVFSPTSKKVHERNNYISRRIRKFPNARLRLVAKKKLINYNKQKLVGCVIKSPFRDGLLKFTTRAEREWGRAQRRNN